MEVIWKVCSFIVNSRLCYTATLHNTLHVFRKGRGTGTATMEMNLSRQLGGFFHWTLFQVFVDVRKSYESLEREICMEILRVYGVGINL